MRASLRRKRQRSIRVLLALIFIVPLASLLALWGFAASVTLANAIQEHNFSSENKLYGGAAQTLGAALAQERMQVFEWLSSGRRAPDQPMLAQFKATDAAVSAFRSGVNAGPGMIQASSRPALANFEQQLATLGNPDGSSGLRQQVLSGHLAPLAAFQKYNEIVNAQFQLYDQLIVVNNSALYIQAAASARYGQGLEMADREITLISGVFASGGQMSTAERVLFAQEVASRKLLMYNAARALDPSLGSGYARANASPAYKSFTAVEDSIVGSIGSRGPIPVSPLGFAAATIPLFKQYQAGEAQDRMALTTSGTRVGDRLLLEVALAGGAGLFAVALSVFLMMRFGRRISRELRGLQTAALDLAEDRLPRVVARLGSGEEIDVAAEAAPLAAGRIAETARVAEAFSTVQRTAVEAAVGQARLRRGVSQVFRNLAWRSQSLLHRQLALLDTMERRQSEPETLDELFQLDHLTTRMRRHAEGLLILSDASPGRGWRDPVPLVDVLRGAIAEVEDYKRVTVLCDSEDAIVGAAVADVIHLLAELIENATTYSPASTEVTLRAERVANGFVMEVEDRGIGIGADEMAAFNERLANPPEFDLADSNQLGLFVVARLAGKHRIRITLRRSPYGGTAAIVLLPHAIVVAGDSASTERFDVFRTELVRTEMVRTEMIRTQMLRTELAPGGLRPSSAIPGGTTPIEHAGSLAAGRLAPYVRPDEDPWGASSVWDTGSGTGPAAVRAAAARAAAVGETGAAGGNGSVPNGLTAGGNGGNQLAAGGNGGNGGNGLAAGGNGQAVASPASDTAPPWLPRRERQASLAPQLKTDTPVSGDDARADATDGPSPAGTRALVESLQYGLDRARTASPPAEDPWPDDSWPPADSRPASGGPDLAAGPEEPGGQ
jgi:signal transduction histidine kinase